LNSYPEIRVFSEPESGSYAARIRGIEQARGDVLAFTDSDCYPVPGWLQAIDKAFSETAAEIILGPRTPPKQSNWVSLTRSSSGGCLQIPGAVITTAKIWARDTLPLS
jgi:glycosyltransferase involved in cell wall biosynthesis